MLKARQKKSVFNGLLNLPLHANLSRAHSTISQLCRDELLIVLVSMDNMTHIKPVKD